jgi:hypothetical protein
MNRLAQTGRILFSRVHRHLSKEMRPVEITSGATACGRCRKDRRNMSNQKRRTKPSMALVKRVGAFPIETIRLDERRHTTLG